MAKEIKVQPNTELAKHLEKAGYSVKRISEMRGVTGSNVAWLTKYQVTSRKAGNHLMVMVETFTGHEGWEAYLQEAGSTIQGTLAAVAGLLEE